MIHIKPQIYNHLVRVYFIKEILDNCSKFIKNLEEIMNNVQSNSLIKNTNHHQLSPQNPHPESQHPNHQD